jgi:hypothetical protein
MQPQHRGGGGEGFLPPAPWPGCRYGVGGARVDPHTTLAVGDSLRRATLRPLASWQTCEERGPWTRRRSEANLGSGRRATDLPHQSRHRANSELSESMRSRRPPPPTSLTATRHYLPQ